MSAVPGYEMQSSSPWSGNEVSQVFFTLVLVIPHPEGARSGTRFSVSFSEGVKVAGSGTRRFEQIWTISEN